MPRRALSSWITSAHLAPQKAGVFAVSSEGTRDGFGKGLVEAMKHDERVMVICADLSESTRTHLVRGEFPDRFVEIGVSEQALASIAAGCALEGAIPFIASYAAFSPGRNWEQIRTGVSLQHLPVKIVGAHAGVSVGPDGATHQMTEDLALMRVLPHMRVVVPCDAIEAHKATLALANDDVNPGYLRLAREASPEITTVKTPFELGKLLPLRRGTDLALFASGPLLSEAILAAHILEKSGIDAAVINVHTLKPFDEIGCTEWLLKTGAAVVIEEAQRAGGLGGLIAETSGSFAPVPIDRVGLNDMFGESGSPRELWELFGLTAPYIVLAAERVLRRKQGKKVSVVPEHLKEAAIQAPLLRQRLFEKALHAKHLP